MQLKKDKWKLLTGDAIIESQEAMLMKRICLFMLALLCGCTSAELPKNNEEPMSKHQYVGKIVEIADNQLMILGKDGLVNVGGDVDTGDLKEGMQISIDTDGTVQETYPMSISCNGEIEIIKEEDNLIGFYLDVLKDLFETDPGLNDKIEIAAFDLSQANNLSDEEKEAFIWMAQNIVGCETRAATYDELVEEGLIDIESMHFETGLLFKLETEKIDENHFTFTMQKWRSGLGAYWFSDCKAVKQGNQWTYEIGAEMIS